MVLAVAGTASVGLNLLLIVVFFVIAATVVRRARPDVAPILLFSLGLDFILSVLSFAAQLILPRLIVGDMTRYAEVQALNTLVTALAHAATRGLLIWSVVRLASPAPER